MRRPDLVPDCGSCAALCCVATSFEASADFAFDKPAGARCRYVSEDCRCRIHGELVARGFSGCAIFDCYGAGQRAMRAFAGIPDAEAERDAAFLRLREIHELVWTLTEAAKLCADPKLRAIGDRLAVAIEALDAIARGPASALAAVDLRAHRATASALLRRVGEVLGGRRRVALALATSSPS